MSVTTRPPDHGGQPPRERPRSSRLVGWGLGAALVVLIAAGVLDSEWNDARSHLAGDLEAECTAIDFRRSWVPDSLTAMLDDVRVDSDAAEVVVRLRTAAEPDPFGGRYESTETFDLIREGTTWRLTGQPWPVYDCGWW